MTIWKPGLKSNVCINGADFLWKPRSSWPERPESFQSTEVPLDHPELKRNTISCITNVHNALPKEDFLLNVLQGISSWYHVLKLIAWILRYRGKLIEASPKRKQKLSRSKESRESSGTRLTVDELKAAERVILICVQQKYFPEEVMALQGQGTTPRYIKKSSPLSKLDPILQDGLLCVGG